MILTLLDLLPLEVRTILHPAHLPHGAERGEGHERARPGLVAPEGDLIERTQFADSLMASIPNVPPPDLYAIWKARLQAESGSAHQ